MVIPLFPISDLFRTLFKSFLKPSCDHRIHQEPACLYNGWHITCGYDYDGSCCACFLLEQKDRAANTPCMLGLECPAVTRLGAAFILYLKHDRAREVIKSCPSFSPVRDAERLIGQAEFALLNSPRQKRGGGLDEPSRA